MSKADRLEREQAWEALVVRYKREMGGEITLHSRSLTEDYYFTITDNVNKEDFSLGAFDVQEEIERRLKAYRSSKSLDKSLPLAEDKPKKQRL